MEVHVLCNLLGQVTKGGSCDYGICNLLGQVTKGGSCDYGRNMQRTGSGDKVRVI